MFDPLSMLRPTLLAWADEHLRDLPWRHTRDPWAVLVAETMLQQTQVARVVERWGPFLERYPDAPSCAAVPAAALLREWSGLGYNRRALMLHRAAQQISERHGGDVPGDLETLLALPGVGPYTARAVLAFAFEAVAAPVDTNIGRVLARLAGATLSTTEAQRLADTLVPTADSWRWNQAVMELGATVCTKRAPACGDCPVADGCAWRGCGDDPAVGSAAVSKPQARFDGSDRQYRGRVIDALRVVPRGFDQLANTLPADDPARSERIVAGLIADGLVEDERGTLRLTGDRAGSAPVQPGPVSEARSASIA